MHQLPLLSIKKSLELYQNMYAKNPSFGMDIFDENFQAEDFLILENNGEGSSSPNYRCDYYILILSLIGQSIRHINQHDYNIQAQSLQLLVPVVIHSFEDISDVQNSYIILFDKSYLSSELNALLEFHKLHPNYIDLVGCGFAGVQYIFEQINREYQEKKDGYKEITKTLVTQLLLLLKREKLDSLEIKTENRSEQIISQFQSLIEEHYQTKKTVQEYADILELTPKHLSETIKELTNKTALHYIHIRILKELQYLLVYTKLSIKQITTMLNFENSSDLGRFFKRFEGISSSKYRLTYQKT